MDENMKKSLSKLIDETLEELEELKKSRFDAAEVKLEGPGSEMHGHPTNGSMGKEEEAAKAEDCEKAEDKAEEKAEEKDEDEEAEEKKDGEDKKKAKKDMEKGEEAPAMEKKEEAPAPKMPEPGMKKSMEEETTLFKSMIDERVKPLEAKLTSILDLVNKIAEQPVPAQGVTYKAAPLKKSDSAPEALNKSQVTAKLFELKKSGSTVDTLDIVKADLGQDLEAITKKYNLS